MKEGAHPRIGDGDQGQHLDDRRQGHRCIGKKRQGETHQPIGTHLEQKRRHQRRTGGGGVGQGIGKPTMQRENRKRHGESQCKANEEPRLAPPPGERVGVHGNDQIQQARSDAARLCDQIETRCTAGLQVQAEQNKNRDPHQYRADPRMK